MAKKTTHTRYFNHQNPANQMKRFLSTLAPKKLCSEKKSCMQEQCVMVASNTFIKLIILYFQEEKCLSNHFPPKIHRRPAPTNPKQSLKLTARMRITLSCEKFPSLRLRQSANSASDLPRLEVRFTTQTLSVSYLCVSSISEQRQQSEAGPALRVRLLRGAPLLPHVQVTLFIIIC